MKMIKISMLALTLGLMSFSAVAPVKNLVSKVAVTVSSIVWKSESIDVGTIPQNTPKPIVFEFKNTGKTTVISYQCSGFLRMHGNRLYQNTNRSGEIRYRYCYL